MHREQRLTAKPNSFWMLGILAVASLLATMPIPAIAQEDTEARLRRAEAEIRALQRTVFTGSDSALFDRKDTGNDAAITTADIEDIRIRLNELEEQLQRLFSQNQEMSNALKESLARIAALESAAGVREVTDAQALSASSSSFLGPQSADRRVALQKITKPKTEDPGDDEYSYGFRLWDAGFYPEARQQLSYFIESYPEHYRVTFGRNLLGRAFLDDGKPNEAARWFTRNYLADRLAKRAPDSLLFLAEAMITLEETRRACIALAEFADAYPKEAAGRLADRYISNLSRVSCV